MPTPSWLAHRAGVFALVALGSLAIAACSGASTASPTSAAPRASSVPSAAPTSSQAPAASDPVSGSTISIKDFAFDPASLTVAIGTTVTWTNDEDALHTVTSGTPDVRTDLFDSGEIDTGVEFPVTFDEAGSYPFFCDRHEFMRGEITVTP